MKTRDTLKPSRLLGALLLTWLFSVNASTAFAQSTYEYDGTITDCNPALCPLVPIAVGDPVTGTITLPANRGESFDLDVSPGTNLFSDYSFLVGGVIEVEYPAIQGDPPALSGVYINGAGAIDALGNLSGTLTGSFVGGTLGGLGTILSIDPTTGAMSVTAGGGTISVATVAGTFVEAGPAPTGPPVDVDLTAIPVMPLSGLILTGAALALVAHRRLRGVAGPK